MDTPNWDLILSSLERCGGSEGKELAEFFVVQAATGSVLATGAMAKAEAPAPKVRAKAWASAVDQYARPLMGSFAPAFRHFGFVTSGRG